jgi:hypothetical protein
MREISVEEAQAGDIVAAPVQDENGRVLLPAGAKLSPAVLSRLKGWGWSTCLLKAMKAMKARWGRARRISWGNWSIALQGTRAMH